METREEPRFVKFATGEFVVGILSNIDRVIINQKPAVRYTVEEDSGELVSFLGTHQINTKIRTGDRGHLVEIKCVGEDVMVKRGDNCMKVFEVRVSKEIARVPSVPLNVDGPEITDADIPF